MPPLPTLSGKEAVRAFESFGWVFTRQHGSHMILKKSGHIATLSVPNHKTVAVGMLRALIRDSGLSVEEFIEALT